MRKITIESANALMNRKNFKKGNMRVAEMNNKFYLQLHGNTIAILHEDGTLMITNAGWFSNVTKERLNGLPNVSIYQKNYVWYLNGKEWNGEMIEVK